MSTDPRTNVLRWSASAPGRSRTVSHAGMVWTVANTEDCDPSFETQARQSLVMLERHLLEAGSSRHHLLSLQVILTDIQYRALFDKLWVEWIGPDAQSWPQRVCFQSGLAAGLQIELVATAAVAAPRALTLR